MTDFLKDKIFTLLDSGKTLVFASEESARGVSVEYIHQTKNSLFASQCISFDSFLTLILDIPDGSVAIDASARMLFSSWFINTHAECLGFLYDSCYPEMKDGLPSFISSILPNLLEAFSCDVCIDSVVSKDLELLRDEYIAFLNRCKLYEINYLQAKKDVDLSQYVIVCPNAFPNNRKVLGRFHNLNFECVEPDMFQSSLDVYGIEKEEIRSTFVSIRNLLDTGASLDQIAISSAGIERLAPYLELEAKLFDIPLNFVSGSKLMDTIPGKFMESLYVLYNEKCRISDMKSFFLNPAMPFKDKESIKAFIADAINQSVSAAHDDWTKDRYIKIAGLSGFDYFGFKRILNSLMVETDPTKYQLRFYMMIDFLFGDEIFNSNEEDVIAFDFIQDSMKSFLSMARSFKESNYNIMCPLMPLFISFIKGTQYSADKIKGINVYPFAKAADVPYKYHFVMTLNDNESSQAVRYASFLSEFERANMNDVDVTGNTLEVYFAFSENVFLSTSRDTYAGQMLPVVALLQKQHDAHYTEKDSYIIEDSNNRCKCQIYSVQKKGFDRASVISLKDYKFSDMEGNKEDIPFLSFSTVDCYENCPFKYALKKKFNLENQPLYDISDYNALLIGQRIHSVMERFYRNTHGDDLSMIERFFDEEMNLWMDGKTFEYDQGTKEESVKNLAPGSMIPNQYMVQYIKKKYLDNMIDCARNINDLSNYFPNGEELSIDKVFDGYGFRLNGKIDKVAKSKDSGNFIVFDYKTGHSYTSKKAAEKSLQFYIYNLLLQSEFGEDVDKGIFEFLSEGKSIQSWENSEAENNTHLKRLIDAAKSISAGDWHKSVDPDKCSGCEFKGICRRRMVIK